MITLWECIWKTSTATLVVLGSSHCCCAAVPLRILARVLAVGAGSFSSWSRCCYPLGHRTPPVRLAIHVPAAFETLAVQFPAPGPAPRSTRGSPARNLNSSWIWLGAWLSGSLVLCVRRARAAFRMKQIADRAAPAPTSIAAPDGPPVRISDEVRTPLTWGLIRPMILLPPCALDWNPACLRSVLEHEREHVRRLDPLSHWLAEVVCVAWWFHPFAWLARNRAAHERECACDDAVLRSGVRSGDYASDLLNLATTLPKKGDPIMALSALSDFERRIKNLLLPGIDRRAANTRTRMGVMLATLALVVPLVVLRAQAPAGQADLSGTVFDITGARVPRAIVTASGNGNREITRADAAGEWALSGIPAG